MTSADTEASTPDPAAPDPPSDALLNWIGENIGPFRLVSYFAHDHSYSRLWRVQSERDSAFYWLKCHQYPGKWAGEVHALTRWIPLVGLAAPRVIAHKSDTPAVLMSEMAGATGDTVDLPPHREEALWRQAGMYLARLHTLENDWFGAVNVDGSHQGMPHGDPVAFICHSIENRLIQGRDEGLFDAAEQAFIVAAANDWTPALEGEIPRAIHRDYSPRNWMTASDGTLIGVIDFEHARWDVRCADLTRGCDSEFLTKPHLADAFLDGYCGGPPDAALQAQIQAHRLLQAIAGIVFAARVNDEPFGRINRDALHRLRGDTT